MKITCPRKGHVHTFSVSKETDTLVGKHITLDVVVIKNIIIEAVTEDIDYLSQHEESNGFHAPSNPELRIREQTVISLIDGRELSVTYKENPGIDVG